MKKYKKIKIFKEVIIYIVAFFIFGVFGIRGIMIRSAYHESLFSYLLGFAIFLVVLLILKFFVKFLQRKGIIKKSFKIQ